MKRIIITQENSKQRIDRFLVRDLFSYTRGEIIRSIKSGGILVNDKKVKPSYILRENDLVISKIKNQKSKITGNKNVKIETIYQDKDVIIINKPAGIQVHPVRSERNTLVNGLIAKFPEIKNIADGSKDSKLRPGIVHRLDKDTSGVMVVARNQTAFNELKKLFQTRKIKKEYLAIVYGKLPNKKGLIEKPIARSKDYKKQTIAGAKTRTKIRPAVTEYEVLKEYKNYSLVKARPRTGRTHQIRVHLSALGHPIVGDDKYKFKNLKTPRKVTHQMLHSSKIEFEIFGKKHSFKSPLPEDFCRFLQCLDEDKIKG